MKLYIDTKKIILSIIILILLTGCGLYNLNNFVLPDDSEFLALIEKLDNPKKIGDYMAENFTYEFHDTYALDPYELYILLKGDCNEFVTFGIYFANYHNYTTYQLGIFYKDLKHRIAIYKEIDYYSITNNQYYSSGYNTFLEIVETDSISRNEIWLKYIVYDYWNDIVEEVYNN